MKWFWAMAVFALIGFFDSAYLTIEHIRGVVPGCTLTGCETVLTSEYASIWGFPTAGLGVIYYGLMLVLIILFLDRRVRMFGFLATRLSIAGLVCSIGFVGIQIFVLGAICQYCMISAVTSLLIFVISVRQWGLTFR